MKGAAREYIEFHSPQKRSKGTRQKKIIPIRHPFCCWTTIRHSSSFYCRVYCLQKLPFTFCYSYFLLAALVLAYLVLSSLLCFWQHETLRDNKDTTSTYIPARETSQLLIKKRIPI